MFGGGLVPVSNVNVQKFTVTLLPPWATFTTPDAHFDHVHIDLVNPLPPSDGYIYLLHVYPFWTTPSQSLRTDMDLSFWSTLYSDH